MKKESVLRLLDWSLAASAVLLLAYQSLMVFSQLQGASQHYSNHLIGILLVASLATLRTKLRETDFATLRPQLSVAAMLGVIVAVVGLAVWLRLNATRLEMTSPFFGYRDVAMGVLFVIALIALTWIIWGAMVAVTVIAFVLYFYWGHLIPGVLGHYHYSFEFVTAFLVLAMNQGVFSTVSLSADTVFFLLIFGVLLGAVGLNNFFFELGKAVGNVLRGGIAYTAVVGCALIAMVTGLGLTNAAIVGPSAIEPMKRAGFPPHVPAAIVATAAQGGQIAPPIMGVTAFLMAAFLNIDYVEIALRAVVPAFLYYLAIGLGVYFLARTQKIQVVRQDVDWGRVRWVAPSFVIPLAVIIYLLMGRHSPMFAGFYATAAILLLCGFQGKFRPSLKRVASGLIEGTITAAQIGVIIAALGLIAQASITTNLGGALGNAISDTWLTRHLLGALVLFTLLNLLLGTGMPTLGAYVVLALTVAPALQDLGISPLTAHFFIFYFAALADITPPIALTINVTAKMAGAQFGRTSWEAMKLSIVAFIIPFVFVYNPSLLDFPRISANFLSATGVAIISTFALSVTLYGYFLQTLSGVKRALFGLATATGFLYVASSQFALLLICIGTLAFVIAWTWRCAQRDAKIMRGVAA